MHPLYCTAVCFSLAVFLPGCASPQSSYDAQVQETVNGIMQGAHEFAKELEAKKVDYDRRLERWQPQLRDYLACNKNMSRVVAAQPGDPMSLAVAARNLCSSNEATLRKAIITRVR